MCFSFLQVLLPSLIWSLLVFVHHVSLPPHFFISFFVWSFLFLISSFFEQQFHPPCVSKKTLQFIPFLMHALPLYFPLLIDLFICCLFFSLRVFSFLTHVFPFSFCLLSITSLKDKFVELLQKKKTCLSIPFLLGIVSFSFLFFSSQEKLQNDNLFYFFKTFFELFTFFNRDSVGKTSCFVFIGPFFFSCFSFICFSCGFLFDVSRSPSQHASLSKCLLYLFISSFCSSSFHLFSFFVSSCFLVSFTFSDFLNFLFLSFYYLYVLCVKLLVEKNLFKLLRNYFFFFSPQKNFVFSVSFSLGLFFDMFFHVWSFSVSWKMVSRFYNPPFVDSFFQLCFSFFSFLMYPKTRMCFCREMW